MTGYIPECWTGRIEEKVEDDELIVWRRINLDPFSQYSFGSKLWTRSYVMVWGEKED